MTFFGKSVPGPDRSGSSALNDLQTGINRLFEQVWHSGITTGPLDGQECAPFLEVIEKNDRYVIEMELPGASREDVQVNCSASQLTIKGQKIHSASRDDGDCVVFSDRRYGSFSRVIPFAAEVRSEEMTAKLDKGLLLVIAPKKTVSATQSVQVPISE